MHAPSHNIPSSSPGGTVINLSNLAFPSVYNQLKVSDLIQEKISAGEYFYGIEISPGLTNTLNYNLFKIAPLFTSIVWVASHNWRDDTSVYESPAVKLAKRIEPSGPVLSHISCQNLTNGRLKTFLRKTINNVMVIRGDLVTEGQEYRHAADLVREIRSIHKDDMCISVGGYPEGHPECTSKEDDLQYLKQKVDAGADFIITQLTFSEHSLIKFIKDCRKIGITVPIVPGIYVPKSWAGFQYICKLTKVTAPKDVLAEYEKRKNNPEEFREYGVQQAIKMINNLFDSDLGIYGVQFFTLNYFSNIERIVQEVFSDKK